MGNLAGDAIHVEERTRGISGADTNSRLQFYLVENHSVTKQLYENSFTEEQKQIVRDNLNLTDEQILIGSFQIEG